MAHVGKKLVKSREGIDRNKLYKLDEALKMVKARASAKFDETVEVAINLGVESLAEFHDVETALAERGADGRRGVRLARRHLKLDQADDFLCQALSPCGFKRAPALRRPPR